LSEKITVGILKERDKSENRVSLVPRDVNLLIKMGLSVELENGAGEKAGFLNKDYENVGTKVSKKLSDKINIITSVNAFSSQGNSYVKNSLVISTTNLRNDIFSLYNRYPTKTMTTVLPPRKIGIIVFTKGVLALNGKRAPRLEA